METSLRFVAGAVRVEGVHLSVISQDPVAKIPPALRAGLAGHWQVGDCFDVAQLERAARALAGRCGPIHRIIAVLEQLQVPMAELREVLGVPGMRAEAARNFRDKSRMKDVLRAAGLPCARHALVEQPEEALAFVGQTGFPVVVKPPAGAGGTRTFRLDNAQDLETYLQRYDPRVRGPGLFEEFVQGTEHSFDSVFVKGRPAWYSISRYMPSPLEVIENPWIQWCVLLPREIETPEFEDVREVAFGALQALGMDTGLSHMEWFRKPDGGIAVSEVGARPPGAQFTSLLSYAHDLDFYRAWPQLMVYEQFSPPPRRYACGAAYVRGQGQGHVRAIHGLDRAQREFGHLVVEARLPRPAQPPSGSYEGDGYVILRHPKTAVVEQALKQIVAMVRVELG